MPKKRAHGDGGLYRIKSTGRWRGVIDDGYHPDGRRRQRYVYGKTQAEARDKLKELRDQIEEHGAPLDKTKTVEVWAREWLTTVCEPNMKPAALAGYESAVNHWIIPLLRKKRVSQLKPSDVRTVVNAILDAGRKVSSAQKVYAVLSSMLESARLEGITGKNVAKDVVPPGVGEGHRDALGTEVALKILRAALDRPDGVRWWFAILTGMRQGERIGATIDSIDWESHEFMIQWSLTEAKFKHGCGGYEVKWPCGRTRAGSCPDRKIRVSPKLAYRQLAGRLTLVRPKSGRVRVFPLILALETMLSDYLEATKTIPNPHGLIWRNPDGSPITANQDSEEWRALLLDAGVISIEQAKPKKDRAEGTPDTPTGHYARHTTATVLMELGVDAKIIGEIVGHAAERTTRRYQHVSSPAARQALEAIGEHFKGALAT